MGKTFFTMLMDADLHQELKLYAAQNGVSMKHLIEQGIDIVLNKIAENKRDEIAGKRNA